MKKIARTIEVAALGICIALVASFLFDLVAAATPARWGSTNWRWGLIGLAGTRLPLPVLGCSSALICLAYLDRGAHGRALSVAVSAFGVLLLVAAGVFIVDGLSIRAVTDADALWALNRSNLLTLPSLLLGAGVLLWSGHTARRVTST